jgi:beta-glucosidase
VLIGDAQGRPRHDFSGTLSFSWPKDATGALLNRGQEGYDPQFAYGYGLSYARPGAVATLSEESGVTDMGSNVDRYFVDGRFVAPWALMLNDAGGQNKPNTEASAVSPRGGVTMRVIDDLAQESGRQFSFSGNGPATIEIWGTGVDLNRQANGEMALSFRYRVDQAPQGRVVLALNGGGVDITDLLKGAPLGEWQTVKVRLSCFADAGASLDAVEIPFQLRAQEAVTLSVSEIRLGSNENDTICPAAVSL